MGPIKKKRCRNPNCRRLYRPDYRNRDRQKYCDRPACKKVSKTASQKKWRNKPENKNHFCGKENVQRVQEWRKVNPGYSKRKAKSEKTLRDSCERQIAENKGNCSCFTKTALQDICEIQPTVIIGLIAQITGTTLQDYIAETLLRMQQLGKDVLSCEPNIKGGNIYDCKTCNNSQPCTKSS